MAHTNAVIGHGTTIQFSYVSTDASNSFCANIIDFDWSGITRAAIDSTHMGTVGAKTFIPGGTYDPGGLSVTLQFENANPNAAHAPAAIMTSTATTATIDFGVLNYVAQGFATDLGVAAADEDVITQAITLKLTGAISTAASV